MSASLNGSRAFVVSRRYLIEDSSQIGEARREITRLAQDLQFDETLTGQIAIVFNELANNLLQHAGRGEIFVRELCISPDESIYGIEILSIDRGPGMADARACLVDGFTTGSTPGEGLGAVQRIAHEFDLSSTLGKGTVIAATFYSQANLPTQQIRSGVVCFPISGETDCGDAWAQISPITGDAIVLADGLGHGTLASRASNEALAVFREEKWRSLEDFMKLAHGRLRSTRGAAISAVRFDVLDQKLHYAGVGNVRGVLIRQGKMKNFVSYAGTVGLKLTTVREVSESLESGDLFILHSDGLSTKWDFADYPGLQNRSPAVIAGVLYRDSSRGTDDSCVWVGRYSAQTT